MPDIFITAAPVGSMPRYLNPTEPKFLPDALLTGHPSLEKAISYSKGWEKIKSGGIVVSQSLDLGVLISDAQVGKDTGMVSYVYVMHDQVPKILPRGDIPASFFEKIGSQGLVKKLVLHLTTHGWEPSSEAGGLVWKCSESIESYISPDLVASLKVHEGVVDDLHLFGWQEAGSGYYQHSKGTTPYLPITSSRIIEEAVLAAKEGASIIHLHTRERSDMTTFSLPCSTATLNLSCQTNKILPQDYEIIIPSLRTLCPTAILNVSTSVRGGGASDGPTRRAHLKQYEHHHAPEICTMSPAEVLFQSGGGYENPPSFLADQLSACLELDIRPEVEVFNHTILQRTLGEFKEDLLSTGRPAVLMLIAGIDQHRRIADGGLDDDSLIPVKDRKEIFAMLQKGNEEGAIDLAIKSLGPIVEEIRERLPEAKVSMLLPGLMHCLLARLAMKLGLDGVRIGLEDGLSVSDELVPGGIRKGRTFEQVRNLREELAGLGFRVLSAEETREALNMPMQVSEQV